MARWLSRSLFAAACLAALAGCGGRRPMLEGRWTPVHVGDCSAKGVTIVITDELFAIQGQNGLRGFGRVKAITAPEPGKMDLHYLPVKTAADGAMAFLSGPVAMRFKMSGRDGAQVEGLVGPNDVRPFPAEEARVLTMRRCPSIWRRLIS